MNNPVISFATSIKDTEFGQRITCENGEIVFNKPANKAIELGYVVEYTPIAEGDKLDFMDAPAERAFNMLNSANVFSASYERLMRYQASQRLAEQPELA